MAAELARSYHTRGKHGQENIKVAEATREIYEWVDSVDAQKPTGGGSTSGILQPGEILTIFKSATPTTVEYEYSTNKNNEDIPRRTNFSDRQIDEIIRRVLDFTKISAA